MNCLRSSGVLGATGSPAAATLPLCGDATMRRMRIALATAANCKPVATPGCALRQQSVLIRQIVNNR